MMIQNQCKKIVILMLTFFLFLPGLVISQEKSIPTIKANSKKVSIKDGKNFKKDSWTIMPKIKPDIYYSSNVGETVTFYTDVDSISVKITEKTKFDFIILLNGKVKAYTQVCYKEPYLKVLKRANLYDENQQRKIPSFTYSESKDENLTRVRQELKLDDIAGKGNEISQLLNIMHWVHNVVRHDGSSMNPKAKNAIELIRVCKEENRGVNCRMMATILNECYLAMGYKSRMVTCMPKPLKFNDCHVINAVYSNQLKKWIWLDPTFDAYVMNEKGELLGIQEVRDRLINDQPLILNPEANWNKQKSKTKEEYLYTYMAKNLYRLEVPINSTYNTETVVSGKTLEYVQLLPLDGINQKPEVKTSQGKNKITYKIYITNNPKQFWEEN